MEREILNEGIIVFHLKGSLNHSSYDQVKKNLKEEFEASRFHLILDFTEVNLVSSLVIGSLFTHHQLLKAHKGTMILCACTPAVREILASLALDEAFILAEDLDQALEMVGSKN